MKPHKSITNLRADPVIPSFEKSEGCPLTISMDQEASFTHIHSKPSPQTSSPKASPRKRSHSSAPLVVMLSLLLLGHCRWSSANPVTDENALAGTLSGWSDWDAQNRLIEAYASEASLLPGAALHLHVSTKPSASYRIEIYRIGWYQGNGARLMACIPTCQGSISTPGTTQAMPTADPVTGLLDANWPTTDTVNTNSTWVSGYYVAKIRLTSGSSGVTTVPFIVLASDTRAKNALVQVPINTWQAYNNWGGKSLYDNNSVGGRAFKVSFNRPYARNNWSLFDHEIQMVRYLEREGYDIAYQTDLETHNNPSTLKAYGLIMSIGHGEYWSKGMRDGFEAARDQGVNLAFFGANTAYWQMRYENSGRTVVEYKSAALDPEPTASLKTDQFRLLATPRPECQLLGIQYNESSWSITGPSFYRDYAVDQAAMDDPWFTGTGFSSLDTLPLAVGYEWDTPTPGCKVPQAKVFFHYAGGSLAESAQASRYVAPSGARVFAAGSLNWSWMLDDWFRTGDPAGHLADKRTQQFTRNLLNDLLQRTPPAHYPPVAMFDSETKDPIVGRPATLTDQSVDQDGSIVSRAWDLNGDGQFNEGISSSIQMDFKAAGVFDVGLKVTDNDGLTAIVKKRLIAVSPVIPFGNFSLNPSFELGINGWSSWQGVLTSFSDSHAVDGSSVGHATYPTVQAFPSFTISSTGSVVNQTVAGHTYVGNAWARAGTPASIGKTVSLKLRETTPGGVLVSDTAGGVVTLSSASIFQKINVISQAGQSGNQMDLRISMNPALPGDAFDADLLTVIDTSVTGGSNQPPQAGLTAPTGPVPVLKPVTLTNTSTDPDLNSSLIIGWDPHSTGLFNEGSGPTSSLIFMKPGTYPVALKVTDAMGATSKTTGVVNVVSCLLCPTNNLTTNPSFEVWTTGWVSQGGIMRIPDSNAVDGGFVARASGQSGGVFTLLDSPRTVTNTIANHRYKAMVYVRAGAPSSVGKSIQLKVREWATPTGGTGTIVKETSSPSVTLSNSFQSLIVTATSQQAGNQLDIRTSLGAPTPLDVLDIDAFTLVDLDQ